MVEANQEISSWSSDLHVPVNAVTKAIVDAYEFKCNVTTFTSNIDGVRMYDIPFAYTPYWDKIVSKC